MPKVVINSAKGLVQSAGSGMILTGTLSVSGNIALTGTVGQQYFPSLPITALTTTATLNFPGVYTVSGTAIVPLTFPSASAFPGGMFIVRNLSKHPHTITASNAPTGTAPISLLALSGASSGSASGSLFTFAPRNLAGADSDSNSRNSSVTFVSDGWNWCIMAGSGTFYLSQT